MKSYTQELLYSMATGIAALCDNDHRETADTIRSNLVKCIEQEIEDARAISELLGPIEQTGEKKPSTGSRRWS